jgi:Fe-S-cluster containining protein
MNLEEFNKKAKAKKTENNKFLTRLKKEDEKKLDKQFHELHNEVFTETDCLKCANCCKTTSPIFRDVDIATLAKHLKMKPSIFTEKFLKLDHEGDYVLQQSPCPFLDADNSCKVYNYRPMACREYPHTNRKKMHQILQLTYHNTLVCPAVLQIVEQLKTLY